MPDKLLYVLYYIAGIPAAYIFCKKWKIRDKNRIYKKEMPYTVGDRKFVIFMSFFSWYGLAYIMLLYLIESLYDWTNNDDDKIANW